MLGGVLYDTSYNRNGEVGGTIRINSQRFGLWEEIRTAKLPWGSITSSFMSGGTVRGLIHPRRCSVTANKGTVR